MKEDALIRGNNHPWNPFIESASSRSRSVERPPEALSEMVEPFILNVSLAEPCFSEAGCQLQHGPTAVAGNSANHYILRHPSKSGSSTQRLRQARIPWRDRSPDFRHIPIYTALLHADQAVTTAAARLNLPLVRNIATALNRHFTYQVSQDL